MQNGKENKIDKRYRGGEIATTFTTAVSEYIFFKLLFYSKRRLLQARFILVICFALSYIFITHIYRRRKKREFQTHIKQ